MERPSVKYEKDAAKVSSYSNLIFEDKNKTMNTRLVYGAIIVLLVTVLALVVALVAVSVSKSDDSDSASASGSESQTGEHTEGKWWDLPAVDCSYASSDLEKANCVLRSYPLVDG